MNFTHAKIVKLLILSITMIPLIGYARISTPYSVLGVQNNSPYYLLLTENPPLNGEGSSKNPVSGGGSCQTQCYNPLNPSTPQQISQQWFQLWTSNSWIIPNYNVCTNIKYDTSGKPQCDGYIGNFSIEVATTATSIQNPKGVNPTLTGPSKGLFQLNMSKGNGPFPDAALATPMTYSDGTPVILSVKENKIVNNKGQTIVLKGVVRPSLEWNPQGQYLSPSDINNMAKWGANVIRLDLNQNYWLASDSAMTQGSYKQIIDAIVYYATQNNMAVILDLHWTTNGQQSPMANQQSIQFWQQVATAYKGFGTVIFELFNEPYLDLTGYYSLPQAENIWLNGSTDSYKYVGYQQLYNTIRATGASNICIVNGLHYGFDLSFVGNGDDLLHISPYQNEPLNLIYGSHPYNTNISVSVLSNNVQKIIASYPIIFTEFGDNQEADYSNGTYQIPYQQVLEFVNQQNASGNVNVNYTGFAWWVGQEWFPTLLNDWNGNANNYAGKLIFQDMQSNPATPLKNHNLFIDSILFLNKKFHNV